MNEKYFLPVSVLVAGVLISGAVLWNGSRPAVPGQAAALGEAPPSANIANVDVEGDPYIGNPNAPVVIAAWGDLQCPFCKKFEVETLPQIVSTYVATGKVRIVFMDLPLTGIHPNAFTLALYGRAVWSLYPERYAAWRAAAIAAQSQDFGTPADINALNATIPGLDAARIAADVEKNTAAYTDAIEADMAEAQEQGVSATPSFVIGTDLVAGAYPFARFQAAIDAVLR